MPNGWYPVPGLDVVLINRTEQRYPRLEWDQAWSRLSAVRFSGPRGFAPRGTFEFPSGTTEDPAADLLRKAQALVAGDPMQGTTSASAAYIDFEKKTGFACGSFSVYGFKNGAAAILLDLTLGAELVAEGRADPKTDRRFFGLQITHIDANGLQPGGKPLSAFSFQFADADSIVISSEPLHYDAHWPPKSSLDCVAIALAQPREVDTLVGLWRR